jgi:hypothetical protein
MGRFSILLVGLAIAVAGCGSGGNGGKPASDADQIKAAITGAYSSFAKADAAGFCGRLTAGYLKDFEQYYAGKCDAGTLQNILSKIPEEGKQALASPQIGALKISGNDAYPEVNGSGLEMLKEGGEWKLDDFDVPGS